VEGDVVLVELLLRHGADPNVKDSAGDAPLHKAVEYGVVDVAAVLLRHGADPNARNKEGRTPLHAAAMRCRADLAEPLLKHGADPNARDARGGTPLYYAANCHVEVVRILLAAGAAPDAKAAAEAAWHCRFDVLDFFPDISAVVKTLLRSCGDRGVEYLCRRGVLHPFLCAAAADDAAAVEEFLKRGVDPGVRDPLGRTALHIAAELCRTNAAKTLLTHGADPNARDERGRTPLHRAADEGCADVAELLLDYGADPNVVDRGGWTPLHLVDIHVDLLEILLSRGAYPNVANPGGETVIIDYAINGYVDEVAVLLDHGAYSEVKDDFFRTPAFYAAEGGHVDVLYLLLDRGAKVTLREAALIGDVYLAEELLKQGADPNKRDAYGRTPLHYAFWTPEGGWRCRVEVAELLLKHGADPNIRDGEGKTPLHYAARHCGYYAVALLLRHGAEADLEAFDEVPWFDTTDEEYYNGQRVLEQRGIMKLFAERGVLSMCYKDCETPLHRIYKHDYYKQPWLLEFGGDPNVRDRHGRTPLHHAAAEERGLEPLLEAGADPNARDKEGKTPLHYAVAHGRSDAVKLLLEYGAEVDEELAEALRLTPLHLAALRGDAAEVERLLKSGADPNVRDVFGRTPLHYASARNHKAVAELLLSRGADPNAKDEGGKTPLDLAAWRCALDVLELLLQRVGEAEAARKAECLWRLDFETKTRRRCWPYIAWALKADAPSVESVLREAAYAGCGEVASILRRRFPAEVVRKAAFKLAGLSPPEELRLQDLRERCIGGSTAWLLLSRGVDPNTRDVHGLTLLHAAAWCGDESAVELLLKAGADPNARDAEGNTPLHVAARRKFPQVVLLLLKHGADPNAANARGETPLHIAARGDKYTIGSDNYAVVSILVKHGADVNARDKDGNTPLHYAAARCAFATASLLLKHGADPNARNNEGKTPADLVNCPKMARAFRRLFSGARR
jgi:ankyrin repeat protein